MGIILYHSPFKYQSKNVRRNKGAFEALSYTKTWVNSSLKRIFISKHDVDICVVLDISNGKIRYTVMMFVAY